MLEEVGWLPAGQMPSRRRLPSSSRRSLDDHPYVGSTSCPMFALGHIIMQRLCPSIPEDNHKHPLIAHSHQRRDVVEYVEGSTVVLVQEPLRELSHVHTAMWTMANLLIASECPGCSSQMSYQSSFCSHSRRALSPKDGSSRCMHLQACKMSLRTLRCRFAKSVASEVFSAGTSTSTSISICRLPLVAQRKESSTYD